MQKGLKQLAPLKSPSSNLGKKWGISSYGFPKGKQLNEQAMVTPPSAMNHQSKNPKWPALERNVCICLHCLGTNQYGRGTKQNYLSCYIKAQSWKCCSPSSTIFYFRGALSCGHWKRQPKTLPITLSGVKNSHYSSLPPFVALCCSLPMHINDQRKGLQSWRPGRAKPVVPSGDPLVSKEIKLLWKSLRVEILTRKEVHTHTPCFHLTLFTGIVLSSFHPF